ncbi:AAA family ATPase [Gottfriedia acidiceleris]|uniref:AAA family ATPase n=1 Tax=Gottfriedia acidiceleris TaxID=371036 RepID=UPI002FFDDC63
MKYWIFQGNPKQFNVDEYLLENDVVTWSIRQKHFVDSIKTGDQVFIWRSDGGVQNSGGIVGRGEVTSDPYLDNDYFAVDIKVIERRLTKDEGMLLRSEIKAVPKLMNMLILKLFQNTNYSLSHEEFSNILYYWDNPDKLTQYASLPEVDKFLYLFKNEAKEWFVKNDFISVNYHFFEMFKQKEYLETLEWEQIQQIGNHLNAFRMGIARGRALGNPNEEIEKYRNSFLYLIYGEEPIQDRIHNFINAEEYNLFGFGASVTTELIGNIFPDKYCFYNQRDKVAVENVLNISPNYTRLDRFSDKFIKFQISLEEYEIVSKYEEIVGRQTNLPIYLEIDQFFSYLYETFGNEDVIDEGIIAKRHWVLSAGENNFMWEEFYSKNVIGIGWKELGDLNQYKTKNEIVEKLKEINELDHNPHNDGLANYQFAKEMEVGDLVYIKKGRSFVIGCGVITSDYIYDNTGSSYHSLRKVDWLKVGEYEIGKNAFNLKTLTELTKYPEFIEKIDTILGLNYEESENQPPETINEEVESYSLEVILNDVFMTPEKVEEMRESLDYKKNIILQGPPGVGKTFVAKRLAYLHNEIKDDSTIEIVQFHQSYSYEDFIQGFKPSENGTFMLKRGIFYEFCQKAMNDPENNYYFIIDEINRGNLSKIFGECMMLIEADKRGEKNAVKLSNSLKDERFYIPNNVYMIGTMNTADRSLAMVDYALRRRFAFIEVNPSFSSEQFIQLLQDKGISQGFITKLIESMNEINREIVNDKMNLGKGFEIGHSYFCTIEDQINDEEKWLEKIIRLEIEPLLREYYFDNEDKVSELLGKLQ